MRIAVFHNRYIHRDGEDAAVDLDVELLLKAVHGVRLFAVDSRELGTVADRMRAGANARWNGDIVARVKRFLEDHPASAIEGFGCGSGKIPERQHQQTRRDVHCELDLQDSALEGDDLAGGYRAASDDDGNRVADG